MIRVAQGETREVYVKYKDEKDKRIGGKDVTVEDVEYLQGGCTVAVEAKANGANLVFKNESDRTEAIVEKCVVKGRKIVDEGQMDAPRHRPDEHHLLRPAHDEYQPAVDRRPGSGAVHR